MNVKPRDGYKIWDPVRRDYLPPEGRDVPADDMYWARALRDGDVLPAPSAAAPAEPAPASEDPQLEEQAAPAKPGKPKTGNLAEDAA